MHKRFLFTLLFSAAGTALAQLPVTQWEARLLAQQPAQKLIQAYQAQQQAVLESGGNLLGNSTLKLVHENDGLTGDEGINNWEVGVGAPLKLLDQKAAYDPVAKAYGQLALAQKTLLQWQARGLARKLLGDYVEADIRARHAQRRFEQAQQLYDLVASQVDAGARSQLDLALTAQRLSEARAQQAQANAELKTQQAILDRWGLTPPDVNKVEATPPRLPDHSPNFNQHPKVQFARAQQALTLAQAKKGIWEASGSPELYVGALREDSRATTANTQLVLEVSLPFGVRPEQGLAQSQWRMAQQRTQAEIDQLLLDLKLAWTRAKAAAAEAQAQVAPAKAQLTAAQKALRLSEQAWRQGEINLRDLLLAQQALLEAQLNAALTAHQAHVAVWNLKQVMGE